jgi:guanylate kinase
MYSKHMELDDALRNKVAGYKPSPKVVDLLNTTPVVLLVAISGGGKDTIKRRLLSSGKYHHIISFTTRPPRAENGVMEQDGVDYHFIDLETANRKLDEGSYIESDIYAGNVYGTGAEDIETAKNEGKIAITDMTIEGALHYLELAPSVKAVFLLPPSYDIWMHRLQSRYEGGLHPEDKRLRLQEAEDEIEQAIAAGNMYIVVNDDLEETIQLVDDIAHNEAVPPHYHKAVAIAEEIADNIRTELEKI